jgi:hypothetical protein
MGASKSLTYRPHKDLENDYDRLQEWCAEHGISMSSVLNSFVPAIVYAVTSNAFRNPMDKRSLYVHADFGDIKIRDNNNAGNRRKRK